MNGLPHVQGTRR